MPAPKKIDVELVVALRAAGEGVRAIARALRVAPSSISRIARNPEVVERIERERTRLRSLGSGERPDAVWLLVSSGNWGFGSARDGSVVMRSFPARLYLEVDEEVVAFAHKANSAQLVLGTDEPPASDRIKLVRVLSEDGACRASAKGRQQQSQSRSACGHRARRTVRLEASGGAK